MKLVLFALLTLLAPATEFSAAEVSTAPSVATTKRQKLVSLPKSRFKSEAAAVREAERRNPGLKATKVIDQKTAWLIRLEG